MSNYKLLYISCGSKLEATKISNVLIKNDLVACTNIFSNINSIFKLKKKIIKSKECILIGKTTKKNKNKIIKLVEKIHSYECPCIIFFNIDSGNHKFLQWIKKNT